MMMKGWSGDQRRRIPCIVPSSGRVESSCFDHQQVSHSSHELLFPVSDPGHWLFQDVVLTVPLWIGFGPATDVCHSPVCPTHRAIEIFQTVTI